MDDRDHPRLTKGPQQMRWYVRLRGKSNDLTRLASVSVPGLSFSVLDEAGEPLLLSDRWEDLANPEAVYRDACDLVEIVRSSMELHMGAVGAIEVDGVRSGVDGGIAYFRFAADALTVSEAVTTGDPDAARSDMPSILTLRAGDLGLRNEDVATALRRLGHAPNWVDAYAVVEIVEKDVRPNDLGVLGWATSAELRRLRATANSQPAVGDAARHGHRKWAMPTNPMSLEEADALARKIVRAWIASKLGP